MVRPINTTADPKQLKILKTPAIRVEDPSQHAAFMVDLLETSKNDPNCVGLAACQIWTDETIPPPRIFTALVNNTWRVVINPTSHRSGRYFPFNEGCMSRPGFQARVKRREAVEIFYTDPYGELRHEKFIGIGAIIIQHELDHLDGKLIS